jgi:hypothetical protein
MHLQKQTIQRIVKTMQLRARYNQKNANPVDVKTLGGGLSSLTSTPVAVSSL